MALLPPTNKSVFNFLKYEATGNDFILIEDWDKSFPCQHKEFISFLCRRNYGIGADGLILLHPSLKADVHMKIFNADGVEAMMCGNALRIIGDYFLDQDLKRIHLTISTQAGLYFAKLKDNNIWVEMIIPKLISQETIQLQDSSFSAYLVDSGVRHLLISCTDPYQMDLLSLAPCLRQQYDANVSVFAKQNDHAWIRTYERGVEAETYSCGSAATALFYIMQQPSAIIDYPQETLSFMQEGGKILMSGNVGVVFQGAIKTKTYSRFFS
ncbi:MAG: diaminopimelate epimerase [Chlamydiales bacterium]|nr:diaminopimelate epimerase [Chlamydiales bacterium]